MSPINNAENADIIFNCVNGGICLEGLTDINYPNNDNINISLSVNWSTCPCLDLNYCDHTGNVSHCMLRRTVIHEVGHALGYVHNISTAVSQQNGIPNTHISGTSDTNYDPWSMFNSGETCYNNCDYCSGACALNQNDIKALLYKYPECGCKPEIIGPEKACINERVNF